MPEVVGEAAILVNPESIEAIKQAMTDLYNHPTRREKLIQLGKKQREKFSWEASARKLEGSLFKII